MGAFIRSMRLKAGASQRELSESVGQPQSFISKVERGERQLQVIEFVLICRWLNVDPVGALAAFLDDLPVLSTLSKPTRVKRKPLARGDQ